MTKEALADPFFHLCLSRAAGSEELVAEFDRLTGFNLSLKGPAVVLEIDKSTGCLDQGLAAFVEFVFDAVYSRILTSLTSSDEQEG